jgi:hypothetical protein
MVSGSVAPIHLLASEPTEMKEFSMFLSGKPLVLFICLVLLGSFVGSSLIAAYKADYMRCAEATQLWVDLKDADQQLGDAFVHGNYELFAELKGRSIALDEQATAASNRCLRK